MNKIITMITFMIYDILNSGHIFYVNKHIKMNTNLNEI